MKRRRFLVLFLMAGLAIALTVSSAMAEEFSVLGRPLHLFGYVTQGGSFALVDKDKYDTEKGLNSALMNLFLEGDYEIAKDLKFYGAGMLTVDWIYQLKHKDSSWDEKLFSKSKSKLNVDDKYYMLMKEARLTWTPGDFMFRAGKQIVSWGELLAFRIMDQINPLDQRRGFLDVEFETTIIPVWLMRADYYPKIKSSWLQDLGFEFVYNPNADFIPNLGIQTGNDEGGIWAPNVPLGGPHLGSAISYIKTPERWKEGNEFGFRVKANMFGAITTLNAFYGRDNSPVALSAPPFATPIPPDITAPDGELILHPVQNKGKYPLLRFVGLTIAKEITPLRASFLGDVAPTIYWEALYAHDSTFVFNNPLSPFPDQRYGKSDDFRTGIQVAWKVKIPFLNPRTYFSITPEFIYRRIMDYPSIENIPGLEKDNYQTFLTVSTSYFHNKLTPSVTWIYDINSKSSYNIFKLVYDFDYHWHFTLGAQFFHGSRKDDMKVFQLFDNKDQIFFKVSYKWG
jgi:hypothetical protein